MIKRTTLTMGASAALVAAMAITVPTAAHAAQGTKTIKASQVAKHKTATNCWTIVGKNVYNLTKWVNKHPGGSASIVKMCGKNSTKSFTAQHGSSAAAKKVLASYKIGTVG